MDFLKKHYEKILLAVILLGLVLAAAALPFTLEGDRENLSKIDDRLPPPKLYQPIDLSAPKEALDRMKNPPKLVLSGEHNTFNPVTWKQKPNGDLVKLPPGTEGAEAISILGIRPLKFEVIYEKSPAGGGHFFTVVQEISARKSARRVSRYFTPGQKSGELQLSAVKNLPGGVDEFLFEIPETKETFRVTKDKLFSRIEGYEADLRYDLENKTFSGVRNGSDLFFDGGWHKIVVITSTQVRIQATATQKQTTLSLQGSPSP
jgi:hypothetical protein